MRNLLFLLALLAGCSLHAQRLSGIFQTSDANYEYVEDVDWESFLAKDQSLNQEGYRLINVETTGVGEDRRYWGIFTQSTQGDTIIKTFGWADFVKAKRAMAADSFLLTAVQGYTINETDAHFIGVWRKEDNPHKIWKLDSEQSLRQKTNEMAAQQFYIKEVEVLLTPAGTPIFLALYHYHPIPVRNYVHIANSEKDFGTDWWERYNSKVRLIDFEQYNSSQGSFYLGVYQPGTYDNKFIRNLDRGDFNGQWEQLEKDKLKLIAWEVRS